MYDLLLPDVVWYDITANRRHGLPWWIRNLEWHPCYLFHQGNEIKHRNVSSRRSVLAGNMGRWASHWPGVLQGMLRRHCRPQFTHVHTYFQIHTPSTMHAFHEPGRLWRNNGRKWKWELCEDLASIRRLSLTFQHSPALYYQLILLNTLSSKHNLFILYLPPSLHLYIKLSLLFLPFPLLSMDRGS